MYSICRYVHMYQCAYIYMYTLIYMCKFAGLCPLSMQVYMQTYTYCTSLATYFHYMFVHTHASIIACMCDTYFTLQFDNMSMKQIKIYGFVSYANTSNDNSSPLSPPTPSKKYLWYVVMECIQILPCRRGSLHVCVYTCVLSRDILNRLCNNIFIETQNYDLIIKLAAFMNLQSDL